MFLIELIIDINKMRNSFLYNHQLNHNSDSFQLIQNAFQN